MKSASFALVLFSALVPALTLAQPKDEHVLTCFTQEEIPAYEFDVFRYSGSTDLYFAELNESHSKLSQFAVVNFQLSDEAVSLDVGPGPEAEGREVWYLNGKLEGRQMNTRWGHLMPGRYWAKLTLKNLPYAPLDMVCKIPAKKAGPSELSKN